MNATVVLLLGMPGSGKGTQAATLSAVLGVPAISTGEMLRSEVVSGSALGRSVRVAIESGALVSDELMNDVLVARLSQPDCKRGFILDGYPRTGRQSRFLQKYLTSRALPQPAVIHLMIQPEEVALRLSRRLQCPACGATASADESRVCPKDGGVMIRRADDCQAGSVANRLSAYQSAISGVVSVFAAHKYYEINAAQTVEEVTREILEALETTEITVSPAQASESHTASFGRPRKESFDPALRSTSCLAAPELR